MADTCIDLTAAARSVRLFKINGFSATKERSGPIASRIWTVGGQDWRIEFHPNCERSYSEPSLMFRVILISKATGVSASLGCRLVDPDPRRNPWPEIITATTFYQNKSIDVRLIYRREMFGSRYLKDESFFVQCAITVLLGEPKDAAAAVAANAAPPSAAAPSSDSDLQKHLGELLRNQKGADITFLVSGESVAAHRCVLAARSPVFMAELFGDMKEKDARCVEIKDMDAEVFKAMLHFLYTDKLPELEQEGEQATLMAQHLLDAADRYGLERLKGICVEKVFTSVTVDTVATTLALAEQHGCSNLKARCMEFILSTPANLVAVAATEGYKHLEASCPSVLTELLKLMAVGRK